MALAAQHPPETPKELYLQQELLRADRAYDEVIGACRQGCDLVTHGGAIVTTMISTCRNTGSVWTRVMDSTPPISGRSRPVTMISGCRWRSASSAMCSGWRDADDTCGAHGVGQPVGARAIGIDKREWSMASATPSMV